MKKILIAILLVLSVNNFLYSQSIKKVILNDKDAFSGYYLSVEPCCDSIAGVLVLLAGFGEKAEWIFPETKLHNVAYANRILTIGFAEGNKISADSAVQSKLSAVLEDVLKKYKVHQEDFVLGGYSAGGIVAMRYVELCNEYPDKYPIRPKGIFTVDSPVTVIVRAPCSAAQQKKGINKKNTATAIFILILFINSPFLLTCQPFSFSAFPPRL